MKTSVTMDEIRKIRDENSRRHALQTADELNQELKESLDWFINTVGKPVRVVPKKEGISTIS
jgi:hypothetical protein